MHPVLVKAASGAAALACAGFMLGSASSAVAQSAPELTISVQSPATLIAHGAAVDVPVVVSCSTDAGTATVTVYLNEAVGKRIAVGGTSVEVGCTGAPETVLVRVFANNVAFSKARAALAQGSIFACNSESCGQAVDSATIRIR
jgi:hypothetical protein